jgi:hypothetical protein
MKVRKFIPYIILLVIAAGVLAIIFIPRSKPEIKPETTEPETTIVDREAENLETNPTTNDNNSTQENTVPTPNNNTQSPSTITDTSKP